MTRELCPSRSFRWHELLFVSHWVHNNNFLCSLFPNLWPYSFPPPLKNEHIGFLVQGTSERNYVYVKNINNSGTFNGIWKITRCRICRNILKQSVSTDAKVTSINFWCMVTVWVISVRKCKPNKEIIRVMKKKNIWTFEYSLHSLCFCLKIISRFFSYIFKTTPHSTTTASFHTHHNLNLHYISNSGMA